MKSNLIWTNLFLDKRNTNTFYRRDAETRGKYLCASASPRLLYSKIQTQRVAALQIQDLDVKG